VDEYKAAWINAEGGPERYLKLTAAAERQVKLMNAWPVRCVSPTNPA
jgi:hypothetical protein